MRRPFEGGLRLAAALGRLRRASVGHAVAHRVAVRVTLGRVILGCAVAGSAVAGCEKTASDTPAALEPCKEVGQRCEYAPGKLGACVLRDGCQGDHCFVCQSQH